MSAILRAHVALTCMDSVQLAEALCRFGYAEDNKNLSARVDRGRFSATFMVQCLISICFDTLELPSLEIVDAAEVADRAPSSDRPIPIHPRGPPTSNGGHAVGSGRGRQPERTQGAQRQCAS